MRLSRQQLLELLLQQASRNGFILREWWAASTRSEWPGNGEVVALLSKERRYYAIIFSHTFAKAFWKLGARQPVLVEATTYSYRLPNGEMKTVHRKAYTTRTLKANAWQYHLREMALYEEPLRYLRRFLQMEPEKLRPKSARFIP